MKLEITKGSLIDFTRTDDGEEVEAWTLEVVEVRGNEIETLVIGTGETIMLEVKAPLPAAE